MNPRPRFDCAEMFPTELYRFACRDSRICVVINDSAETLHAIIFQNRFPERMIDVGQVIKHILDDERFKLVPPFERWLAHCSEINFSKPIVQPADTGNPINSYYFIEQLDKQSGSGDVFVSDVGSAYYITGQALRFYNNQRDLTSGGFATMRMALPLSIGAAASSPDSRIFAITGDGSIELNIQELRTISENNLNIKVFVLNNGGYASIRDSQDDFCGGAIHGIDKGTEFFNSCSSF